MLNNMQAQKLDWLLGVKQKDSYETHSENYILKIELIIIKDNVSSYGKLKMSVLSNKI